MPQCHSYCVPDPTEPDACVHPRVAEDIKDCLVDVVLAGMRGAAPDETYRMTAATLAEVFRRVLLRLGLADTTAPQAPLFHIEERP